MVNLSQGKNKVIEFLENEETYKIIMKGNFVKMIKF